MRTGSVSQRFAGISRRGKKDNDVEFAVVKTIVGFMNSKGGVLLIGVEDDGTIHGLEDDYKTLPKPSKDGFELHLRQIVQRTVGVRLLIWLASALLQRKEKTSAS